MVLVLVIGDLHIPYRANDIPLEFKKLFQPGRFEYVIITGNLCSRDVLDYFRSFTSEVYVASGEFDDANKFDESKIIQIEDFRIGLIHGHQVLPWGDKDALDVVERRLNADLLISGHTHKFAAYEYNGHFFLNPGSATGAYSALTPLTNPEAVKPEDRVKIHQLDYSKNPEK